MNSLVSLTRLNNMEFSLVFVCLLCSFFLRPSNSQDAQEDDTFSVTGPESLVTDGTSELTLTCGTDISASVAYSWRFPSNETRVCASRPVKNVCNFRPRLEDDMQNVTCAAIDIDAGTVSKATYTLRLFYPPESRAAITIEPPQTEPLKQGDIIICTVTGGKPRVTNITFHCQHQDHADREDDVSDNGTTVSSSIRVDTPQATEVNMTCTCSAHWDPEPELYDNITNAEFMLEFSVSSPQSTTPLTEDAGLSPGAVTGIVVGTIFLLTFLLIAVFCKIKRVKKVNTSNDRDQQYRDTADVSPRNNTLHQLQQQTQQRRQQQLSVVEAQPQDASDYQDMTGTHTYINGGNTYDVPQRDQQDDTRTYTELVTSSGADSDTYLELVNSIEGDYEIP